jgi:hypothetical protein
MYEALIMLSEALNPSIEEYAQKVRSFYESNIGEKPKIEMANENFRVIFKGIEFSVDKNCDEHVIVESKGLASFAKPADRAEISKSKCRFEISSTDDTDMVYFNDYLFLIQSAEELGEVYAFSPLEGEFM